MGRLYPLQFSAKKELQLFSIDCQSGMNCDRATRFLPLKDLHIHLEASPMVSPDGMGGLPLSVC